MTTVNLVCPCIRLPSEMKSRCPTGAHCLRNIARLALLAAVGAGLSGCERQPPSEESRTAVEAVRGAPITGTSTNNNGGVRTNVPFVPADFSRVDEVKDGFVQLGWDKLSGFKFDVYESYSETNVGRALVKSDDTIPPPLKAYDGRRVGVSGFILPLRTKKGLVTGFLLLRDQGTCCFGAQAQINHFVRVKYLAGFKLREPVPWKVSGTIHVGEIYVQGYLTGIYHMEAEQVAEVQAAVR